MNSVKNEAKNLYLFLSIFIKLHNTYQDIFIFTAVIIYL